MQAYPAVYGSGTTNMLVQHEAFGGPSGVSQGSVQSNLAQLCAPPRPPTPVPFLLAYALAAFVLYDMFIASRHIPWKQLPFAVGALFVGWLFWRSWRSAARLYSQDKQRWVMSRYCYGCGQSYLVS